MVGLMYAGKPRPRQQSFSDRKNHKGQRVLPTEAHGCPANVPDRSHRLWSPSSLLQFLQKKIP